MQPTKCEINEQIRQGNDCTITPAGSDTGFKIIGARVHAGLLTGCVVTAGVKIWVPITALDAVAFE